MQDDHREEDGASGLEGAAGASRMGQEVQQAGELLRASAAHAGAGVEAGLEAGRDQVRRQWDQATDQVVDWHASARDSVRGLARAADECAHRHAWESIALAAVAGAITAFCVSRRMSRD